MTIKYLGIVLVLAGIASASAVYGDTNVLKNPGFEDGNNGWAARSCKIEVVKSPVHGGTGAAKAFGRAETWQGIKQSLLGKVTNGTTYKISAWVRLENADTDTVTISIEQTDDSGTNYKNVATGTANKTEWVQLSGEFKLEANGALKTLDVYLEGPAAGIEFYVDDVVVSGLDASKADPAADPNAAKKDPADPNAKK